MKGFGIVFSGGGGKGAYEIGVWKYLHEIGLDSYVRAVSGTSVGALNAALFVGSSYEKAEKMWLKINKSKILSPRKISPDEISQWLSKAGFSAGILTAGVSNIAAKGFFTLSTLSGYLLVKTKGEHFFSRDGLTEMIKDCVDFDILQNNDIPCFVTCLRYPEFKTDRFKLNEYSPDEITTLLLASSAIPLIFPKEEFRGRIYYDGGFPIGGDNAPIRPVYDTGVENIIVVHLNRETVIDKSIFPDSNIIEIVPSEELGNTINVLSVQSCSNELDKRIQQLSVDMEKINSGVTTINDIDSELKSLTEFVNCLWSATKALWIDSLISDFDNSFNFETDKIVNSERQAYKTTKNSYESGYGSDYYWSIDNERD